MKKSIVTIHLSKDKVMSYYNGNLGLNVFAYDKQGQSIQLPMNILLDYVTHDGIHGTFEIVYTEQGRFKKITKIS